MMAKKMNPTDIQHKDLSDVQHSDLGKAIESLSDNKILIEELYNTIFEQSQNTATRLRLVLEAIDEVELQYEKVK